MQRYVPDDRFVRKVSMRRDRDLKSGEKERKSYVVKMGAL